MIDGMSQSHLVWVQVTEERFPSAAQAHLILASWQEIQTELDQIGFETFKQLFVANSDIKACVAHSLHCVAISVKRSSIGKVDMSQFLQLTEPVAISGLLPRHEKSEQQ